MTPAKYTVTMSAAKGLTKMNVTPTSSSRMPSVMRVATLFSRPVNANTVEPVTAHWTSAFENFCTSASEPRRRKSAIFVAFAASTLATNDVSARERLTAMNALTANTASTKMTSQTSACSSNLGSSNPRNVTGGAFLSPICGAPIPARRPMSAMPKTSRIPANALIPTRKK